MKSVRFIIIAWLLLFTACDISETLQADNGQRYSLTRLQTISLAVPEPSGLALSLDHKSLWTVSDGNSTVYQLDLEGAVIHSFTFREYYDLEGIVIDPDDRSLWVVDEAHRELIKSDKNGTILFRKQILEGVDNSGLEGVTIHPDDGHFYTIKEKQPGLFIELDSDFNVKKEQTLDFANDYSDITYSKYCSCYLILSDESQSLTFFDPDSDVISSNYLGLDQAEGVAMDDSTGIIYFVSDSRSELYIYRIVAIP